MSLRPHQLKAFRGFLDSLGKRLSSLEVAISRCGEAISGIRDEKKTENEAQQEISRQISLLAIPKEERKATNADQERHHWENHRTQRWIARGTWFTGICTLFAFWAAFYYAIQARKQSETMEKTYCEIQKQTALMRQEVVGTEQAIIRLENGYPILSPADGMVRYEFTNLGAVPAKKLTITDTVSYVDIRTEKTDRNGPRLENIIPLVPHTDKEGAVAPEGAGDISSFYHSAFVAHPEKWERFKNAELAVRIDADISYNNGFDETESLPHICYYFFGYVRQGKYPDTYTFTCDSFPSFSAMKKDVLPRVQENSKPN